MQVEACLKKFLERGLIGYIFELASSGFANVKHVCSACLHLVPESIPNMEDPLALELVLCLLEAQGDKFSEISTKPIDSLTFPLESCNRDSNLTHNSTNFIASWTPFTCLVENLFTPALMYSSPVSHLHSASTTIDPASIVNTERHKKLKGKDYDEFQSSSAGQFIAESGEVAAKAFSNDSNQNEEYEWNINLDHGITHKQIEKQPPHGIGVSDALSHDSKAASPHGLSMDSKTKFNFEGQGLVDTHKSSHQVTVKFNSFEKSNSLTSSLPAINGNTVEIIKRSSNSSSNSAQVLPSTISYKTAVPVKSKEKNKRF
jgi:hypothetical protein